MINNDITVFEAILIGLLGIYLVRMMLTYFLCLYYFSRYDPLDSFTGSSPRISIIKSIWGMDAGALNNFRSFCKQDYSNDYEIIFCAENRNDPSIPLIRDIISEYPEKDIRLVFSNPGDKRWFGKIKNMITGLKESKYEVIMFSDSDVYISKTFIRESISCLNDPDVGLVYWPPFSVGAEDWKAAMLNMAVNENTMNITLLHILGIGTGAVGTTMAMRRNAIEEIGGLEQFGRQVTDDIPLARAIHKKGYRIRQLKEPVWIYHPHDTFYEWWKHMVRWLVIIRRYMPFAVYAGLFDIPLLLSILYLSISGNILSGILLTGGVLFFRLGFSALINMQFIHDKNFRRFIWTIPVMDLLKIPLLINSCLTNKIEWRKRKIRVNRDGSTEYR